MFFAKKACARWQSTINSYANVYSLLSDVELELDLTLLLFVSSAIYAISMFHWADFRNRIESRGQRV